jgi:hypothetical protein
MYLTCCPLITCNAHTYPVARMLRTASDDAAKAKTKMSLPRFARPSLHPRSCHPDCFPPARALDFSRYATVFWKEVCGVGVDVGVGVGVDVFVCVEGGGLNCLHVQYVQI